MNTLVDEATGEAISLSSRFCRDSEHWKETTPSLQEFSALRTLDLHGSQYIRSLHDSLGSLSNLKSLVLTRCERLESLPDSIGNLQNLQEVRFPQNF